MADYTVKVVEIDGTLVRTLVNCNVLSVTWEINGPGEARFTIPKYETGGAVGQFDDCKLGREIQVWRDSTCIFWGIPLRRHAAAGAGDIEITAPGVAWYFGKRAIDAPLRNELTNGNFEAGTTGWTAVGCTMTSITSPVRRGSKAVRLVGTSTFAEQYITQSITLTGTGVGTAVTVASHFMIESWTGPAINSRGLYVESRNGGTLETYNEADGVIDDDTALALNNWQRAEITTWLPPNATRTIYVRHYVGNATIVVDELELVKPSSLAIAPGTGEAITTTANRIVSFIQDPANGKSDLGIDTTTAATTTVTNVFPRAWQYAEHSMADRALNDELVPLGMDWSIEVDATTKTFTTYAPQKGVDLTGTVALELGVNVADYSYDDDGAQTETDITILGEGDGPDREEGYTSDTSETAGLVLQGIYPSPPGTTVDKLDGLADDHVARSKRLVRLLSVTTHDPALVGAVLEGDTVPVTIDDGVVQVAADPYRVTRIQLTPRNDTMVLDFNEAV